MLLVMLLTMLLLWFLEWRPVIRKTILGKSVLKSCQSRSSSSNDQSILPKETPSVTQPEIVDSDSGGTVGPEVFFKFFAIKLDVR